MLDKETEQWIEDALKVVKGHGDIILTVHAGKITGVDVKAKHHVLQVKKTLTTPKDLR